MNTCLLRGFFLFCQLAYFAQLSRAQDAYDFTWFTTEQGLPDNKVYCVFEDSRGLVWVGSHYGLSLYLGNGFKNYLPGINDAHSIGNAIIMDIVEDQQGHLWMAGFGEGLYEFDPQTNLFKTYRHDPADASTISGINVSSLYFDKDGMLWVGTYDNGLNKFDPRTGRCIRFNLIENASDQDKFWYNSVFDILEDEDDLHLWLAANNRGIVRFNKQTGATKYYSSTRPRSERTAVQRIMDGPQGNLWAATYSACMALVDKKTGQYQYFPIAPERWKILSAFDNIAVDFARKSDHEFWVASLDRGLAIFNTNSHQYTLVPTLPFGDNKQSVRGVFVDSKQRLWVVNEDNGLSLFDPAARAIGHASIQDLGCPENGADITTDLEFDPVRKLLYATTNTCRGLYVYKRTEDGRYVFDKPAAAFSTINCTFYAVACDVLGRVWVGGATRAWSGGKAEQPSFFEYQPETNRLKMVRVPELDALQVQDHEIHDIVCEEKSGIVWLASAYNGLIRWDVAAKQASIFRLPKPSLILSMDIDKVGNIWFTTLEQGLCVLNIQTGQIRCLMAKDKCRPLSVAATADGKIWATIDGGGVWIYDAAAPNDQVPVKLGTAEGLPTLKTCKVAGDAKGRMWVSTERGLCLWDAASRMFKTFRVSDGLKSSFLYKQGLTVTPMDEVLVGQVNGINWLGVQLPQTVAAPKIFLTGLQVNGKDFYPEQDLNYSQSLSLDHDQNFFTLFFTSLQYTNADKNIYLYRLKGFDKNWVSPTAGQRNAGYTGVPPGDYVFEIKTADYRGVWSEQVQIKVSVHPPWYATWWFYTLLLTGLCALVMAIYWRRTAQIKQAFATKQQLFDLERRALQAQMNPHFIFNCLTSIQNFISEGDKENAMRYINQFAQLTRTVLNFSGKTALSVEEEIEVLKLYLDLEKMRKRQAVECTVEVAPEIDVFETEMPPMLIQPFAENAFKHGNISNLTIKFEKKAPYLVVTVRDDGIGLNTKKHQTHLSKGTEITRQRLALWNGKDHPDNLRIEQLEKGVLVTLQIRLL